MCSNGYWPTTPLGAHTKTDGSPSKRAAYPTISATCSTVATTTGPTHSGSVLSRSTGTTTGKLIQASLPVDTAHGPLKSCKYYPASPARVNATSTNLPVARSLGVAVVLTQ